MNFKKKYSVYLDYLTKLEQSLLNEMILDRENLHRDQFTIEKIAERYHVSKSTVHRLSKKLDYDSFVDFRHDFFESDEKFKMKEYDVYASIKNCEKTYLLVNETVDRELLEKIYFSKRIMIYGMGMSRYLAEMFRIKLSLCGKRVEVYDDSRFMRVSARNLDARDDFVIVLSRSGKPPELLEAVVEASLRNVEIALLTEESDSPIAQFANYLIMTPASIDLDSDIDTRLQFHIALDVLMNKLLKLSEEYKHGNY